MEAAAAVSESGAALLLQSSPAAQVALLGHLAMMEAQRPLDPSEELWRVRKGSRELVCVAVYMSHGVDLRLLEDGDIRRTRLHRRPETVAAKSAEWRDKLLAGGWEQVATQRPSVDLGWSL